MTGKFEGRRGRRSLCAFALALGGLHAAACSNSSTAAPPPPSVAGAWSGTATDDAGSVQVLFELTEDAGALSGVNTLYDPSSHAPIKAGSITGKRTGASASWVTMGGIAVTGTFAGEAFNGTATFPGALDIPEHTTSLHLTTTGTTTPTTGGGDP